jgi:aryl-alcohol dehydrogenase-like predicted oxidoreductase
MDDATAIRIVRDCVAHGITLIDTAQSYHTSEALIGQALRGLDRDRVFLATKVSHDFSPVGVRAALETSLRQLGTDHVELYQIHRWDSAAPIEATMEPSPGCARKAKSADRRLQLQPGADSTARRIAPCTAPNRCTACSTARSRPT